MAMQQRNLLGSRRAQKISKTNYSQTGTGTRLVTRKPPSLDSGDDEGAQQGSGSLKTKGT